MGLTVQAFLLELLLFMLHQRDLRFHSGKESVTACIPVFLLKIYRLKLRSTSWPCPVSAQM